MDLVNFTTSYVIKCIFMSFFMLIFLGMKLGLEIVVHRDKAPYRG